MGIEAVVRKLGTGVELDFADRQEIRAYLRDFIDGKTHRLDCTLRFLGVIEGDPHCSCGARNVVDE
jgi:hypothetical protein